MCRSGNVNVFQWNRKLFFSRHVHFDSPEVNPASSRLEVGLENVILPIFLEEFFVLLLVPDDPGSRWMFSDAVLSQRFLLISARTGKQPCLMKDPLMFRKQPWYSRSSTKCSMPPKFSTVSLAACPPPGCDTSDWS